MRPVNFILVLIVFLFSSCNSKKRGIPSDFKIEIPTYLFGTDIFYESAKVKQRLLELDSLENGYQDLQIRIWYNVPLEKEQKLIIITNKDTNWSATAYYLYVGRNGQTETLLSKKTREASPKSGWPIFSKKLLDLKIITLPNQDDVEGYSAGDTGTTYSIELATKDQYRFYNYWQPQEYQERFWQAKNMTEILNLIDKELGI